MERCVVKKLSKRRNEALYSVLWYQRFSKTSVRYNLREIERKSLDCIIRYCNSCRIAYVRRDRVALLT